MKTLIPITLLLVLSFSSLAQAQKITVFCRVSDIGRVDYGSLRGLLSLVVTDSVLNSLLFDPRKQSHGNNIADALDLMTMNGWKVVAPNTGHFEGTGHLDAGNYPYFLLTRDIDVDEKGKALFMDRLKTVVYGN